MCAYPLVLRGGSTPFSNHYLGPLLCRGKVARVLFVHFQSIHVCYDILSGVCLLCYFVARVQFVIHSIAYLLFTVHALQSAWCDFFFFFYSQIFILHRLHVFVGHTVLILFPMLLSQFMIIIHFSMIPFSSCIAIHRMKSPFRNTS